MQASIQAYPWAKELEKTVVHSLTTSFGLDFLLFEDKRGGNVDTIHNVRNGIWVTESEQARYEKREAYDSAKYHNNKTYKTTGEEDKEKQKDGTLYDPYTGKNMGKDEQRNLDHVISAKEVHDDAGRVLAEIDGAELANKKSNLQTTSESINKSKKADSVDEYLSRLPSLIESHNKELLKNKKNLSLLPRETPEQQHKARELEDKIRKLENKIGELESIKPEGMKARDRIAREKYNRTINAQYYSSSKFLLSTGREMAVSGLRMGTRQMLGLLMAECWFELRERLPEIMVQLREHFRLEVFLDRMKATLEGIWERVKSRFSDFLIGFKEGVFAGVMASATTTLFNIFATTQRQLIKIIRETWMYLSKALKLIFFNPEGLPFAELCQAVVSVISVGVATVIGTGVYTQLVTLLSFPFGAELAAFMGALTTGILTLGFNYFLIHSNLAQRAWAFVATMDPYSKTLDAFKTVNRELDRYLTELARYELNMDPEQMSAFAYALEVSGDELERGFLIKQEISRRKIDLPFEMGNSQSVLRFLVSKAT